MIELGRLIVDSNNSLIVARKKAREIALKLGCTEILATRIEAALSDIIRQLLTIEKKIDFLISIVEKDQRKGVMIVFRNLENKIKLNLPEPCFDEFKYSKMKNGKYQANVYMPFVFINPEFSDLLIKELRAEIKSPSKEELIKEIELKNIELANSRQFMESVLENLQAAVYVKDLDGRYTYLNKHWEDMTGFNREDCIGKNAKEIYNNELGDTYDKNDLEVIRLQKTQISEEISANQAVKRTYLSTKVPMKQNGNIVGLCSISTDISLRKQMEEALFEAKMVAEEAAKSKSDFLANMSHEIRTPMNAILGMGYLIEKTDLSEKQKDYIDKIKQSGQHLLGIINDILDFSKIEAGKLNIESINFKLDEVLDNLTNCSSEKCLEKGLELVFDIAPDVPNELCGDPLRIGQILINYVNNAIKFTDSGEIVVKIRKEQELTNEFILKFEVHDTGIGLTNDQRSKLFQSFHQGDTSTTRKYGGTGLGLAISKNLADLMGGEVGVESVIGEGSNFWFTTRFTTPQQIEESPISYKIMNNVRALVVDDNHQARLILSSMLKSMSVKVDETGSGKNAIEMILSNDQGNDPYDIIFIDMQMPHLNGIQTIERLNQRGLHKTPKYVMVTGYGREDVFFEAKRVGIEVVLVKPVNLWILYETTLRILGTTPQNGANEISTAVVSTQNKNQKEVFKSKILLVEDNELNQQVAIEILEEGGFAVDVADNGQKAVAMVNADRYDLVLMDMQMPILDGLEATKQIRMTRQFKDLVIIAMTANAMAGDRERCIAAGMNDYLPKPIDPSELFKMMARWIPSYNNRYHLIENKVAATNAISETNKLDLRITGLDVEQGLKRVLGKKKSYLKLLRKFVCGQKNMIYDLEQAIKDGDYSTAERLIHTLKGAAGNIGAIMIQESAIILETAIREYPNKDTLKELIGDLNIQLNNLFKSLEENLPAENIEISGDIAISSKEELLQFLEALKPALQSRKPKKCTEVLESSRFLLWPYELNAEVNELSQFVSKYKFKEAIKNVESLIIKLSEV